MAIIAVCSLKGGVGKSTAAANLGLLAARGGERTLVWDLDVQAAATRMLAPPRSSTVRARALVRGERSLEDTVARTAYPDLDLAPAGLGFRRFERLLGSRAKSERFFTRQLEPLASAYRWIVLDCPPGLGCLTEGVVAASHLALVPVVAARPSSDSAAAYTRLWSEIRSLPGAWRMADGAAMNGPSATGPRDAEPWIRASRSRWPPRSSPLWRH